MDENLDLRGSQGSVVNPATVTQLYEGRESLTDEVHSHGRQLGQLGADLARLEAQQKLTEEHNERRAEDVRAVVLQVIEQMLHTLRDDIRNEFAVMRTEMARLPKRRRYLVFSVAWFFLLAPTPLFFRLFWNVR